MATTAVTSKHNLFFSLGSGIVYLALALGLLFLYLRGLFQLLPFRERVIGGTAEIWPRTLPVSPVPTLWLALILVLLVVLAIAFRRQLALLIHLVPAQARGLVLPLPVYLLLTGDYVISGALAALSLAVWVFGGPLGSRIGGLLRPAPTFLWAPLGRLWPAILYAMLFRRDPDPVHAMTALIVVILLLWVIHYLDRGMEIFFAPVWDWLRGLSWGMGTAVLAGRLLVGFTAPYVLSYHLAWFTPGPTGNTVYDRFTVLYGIATALACFFITRGPGPAPQRSLTSQSSRPAGAGRAARIGPAVAALGSGLLLALGLTGVAHADDCSGPSDCAGTNWVNNAGGNAAGSTGAGVLGSLINWLFPPGGKFVGAITDVGVHARERIIGIGSHLDPADKQDAFDSVREGLRGGARNYDELVERLRSGKLDNQAAQIESDMRNSAGYVIGAQEAGATVGQIVHTEGGKLVEAGAELNVEIVKTVLGQTFGPDMTKGFDMADKANEWADYAQEVYDDPVGKLGEYGLDKATEALSERIKEDLKKRFPNLPEEELENLADQISGKMRDAIAPDKE